MRKVALHNLGCKVNAYETEAMRQALEENGNDIVSFNEKSHGLINIVSSDSKSLENSLSR